ncbi:hypothetical protein D7Z96_05900 [Pseudarthrobacter phenanthrenivorans]|uniref:Uncharacterized protein n=1 Tax=Pseudarthrobacter phenanthrenivorans TaxID=361575 RepID=A0A3B0FUM3_PSEPS|nr:hypothetical protein [Pseudarthrobacter phenanthrenivorans]RKO25341.1 hypothetical protein D7Z96_05900 [Pseudarthrobacter phenanthrenivorans]
MTRTSSTRLLVLHAVRVLGYAPSGRIAGRTGLPAVLVEETLAQLDADGMVSWACFGDDGGWSVTEAGKTHGEHLLAAELDESGARAAAGDALERFGPLNSLVTAACTRWQLTELGLARPAAGLDEVLADLNLAAAALALIEADLTLHLGRFRGYHSRFAAAVRHAQEEPQWVNGIERDSAHRVWFELHEDLLATLGMSR